MTKATRGTWRYNLVFGLLAAGAVGLCGRMAWLVRSGQAEAAARAQRQQQMIVLLPGRPGSIFARTRASYVPVVISRQVPSCYIDPLLLDDKEIAEAAIGLGEVLSLNPVSIQEQIVPRKDKRFAWIKRGITEVEAQAVRKRTLPGVRIVYEWDREYPSAAVASAVVGFRLRDGRAGGGLELSMEHYLTAVDGQQVMLADTARRPIWPVPDSSRPPKDGGSVFLCLDVVIQDCLQAAVQEAVAACQAKWGVGVMVDPFTGDVLAISSFPSYDPAEYATSDPNARLNRAICVPFEPGSAIKPIFAAAAVEAGLATYQTQVFCENGLYAAPRGGTIRDHGQHYGWLTVEDVIVHSSNIGMAKIGEKLGNRALYEACRRFGLGQKTDIPLPGESPGILRDLKKWDGYSLRRVPFGQEISVTALQMAMAFSALANGGVLMAPRLVDHVRDADGRVAWRSRPKEVRRVVSPSVAAQTLAAMQQVVQRGTGKACQLRDWTSFGKTGTAQIPGGARGYVENAYTGTFVGGAPADRPRVICLISVYWPDHTKGYYGAKVAAPYVKKVLEQAMAYLDVPPDKTGTNLMRSTSLAGVTDQ